ncbi:DEAD/DEAH box helicase family protein [Candidatus Chlorohelix sp.]|uniref:type I restriction endonuclease subunit R n=1 Tax=Candidatus Chlorohelix sp. TaxID=3139201 RepID=UPI00304EF0CA
MDTSEKNFEEMLEKALLAGTTGQSGKVGEPVAAYGEYPPGGYYKRLSADYNRELCLIPDDLIAFIKATQIKEWLKYEKYSPVEPGKAFSTEVSKQAGKHGTLYLLRKGITLYGCAFKLAYFPPNSALNLELQTLYEGNIFSVARQLKYSLKNENSLDVALFLNGLPLFTAELKNPFKGQNVTHAVHQYRFDRDPKEPLLSAGRCLAHFAVDPDLVQVTTQLESAKTRFLPFNRGKNGGAGNEQVMEGFATAYLWESIWSKPSVLNLIQNFIHELESDGKPRLIFPRYHQLEAVRGMVKDAAVSGTGKRYLIQHSAGSGKSNTIAWLAHQLSVLHDSLDKRVFDSIIIITDRRVLDKQLQNTVSQFGQTPGVVENIDKNSKQLKKALEDGKTIIITTLQKFPMIMAQAIELAGKRFALIIDEAHSSQSGESSKSLKKVLAVASLEEAEQEDSAAEKADDLEDKIMTEIKKRGQLPNISTFAFTATPKAKTLELFGTKKADGSYVPFSLYSMRQAIEERFILDVLENYTTYNTYWNLLKKIEDDPQYDKAKASYLLQSFVNLNPYAIRKKVEIIVEHFAENVRDKIGGKAKAMIVTSSRLHAVRYRQEVDKYFAEKGYKFKALAAFSGTVKDGGLDYTEAGMNHIPETQTAEKFKEAEYRFLIVANKFQTGFDQPLLHTMYVDKKLGGVNAVQTLSRLNRVHPEKNETMVLDFANETKTIQDSFQPYYERTILSEGTDPNLLYDYQTNLSKFHLYSDEEVDQFAAIFYDAKATQDKLHNFLTPIIDRYKELEEQKQVDFRGKLIDYIRLYAFLSQILPFADTSLEKLYEFGKLLQRKLPIQRDVLPLEVQQAIDIESYRVQETTKGKIKLKAQIGELDPIKEKQDYGVKPEDIEPLSLIISELNKRFGTEFGDEDKLLINNLEEKLHEDISLKASLKASSTENVRLTFEKNTKEYLQEFLDKNFKFYKQVNDNPDFSKLLMDWLFKRYLDRNAA